MRLIDLDEFLRQNCIDRIEGKSCEECKHHVLEVSCERLMEQPTAERVGKWIPCSERLPEEGWCLCTVHGVFYDYCEILSCQKRKRKKRFLWLDEDGEYFDFTERVLAWMPLPEPWRREEDEV